MEIMIDIETLDTRDSAVVLSFAAVQFNVKNGDATPGLYCALNIDEQLRLGRTVSADTLAWWARQPDEARLAALAPPASRARVGSAQRPEDSRRPVGPALALLEALFAHREKVEAVWSKSPTFDIVILESLYKSLDRRAPVPWHWRQLRDLRTMEKEVDLDEEPLEILRMPELAPHHPLFDCYTQIASLQATRAEIKECCGKEHC